MADDENALRETAIYARTVAWLRSTQPGLTDAEMDAQGLAAVPLAVFGHDAKKDRNGNFIQQGIGSAGHETANHFASIRRWEGKEAWEAAVRKLWKENPAHAAKLGLPQLSRST
jgi:hypothetical protein